MIIVDTWLVYKWCTGANEETQKNFYELLAEELIDNFYDDARRLNGRKRLDDTPSQKARESVVGHSGKIRSGASIHLTPTKEFRKVKNEITKMKNQGWCKV